MFVILSGSSGSGKNTIIKELLKEDKKLRFMKTCTTREQRDQEKADSYIYLDKDEFEKLIDKGELFEFEEIHGNYYGTLKKSIDEIIKGEFDFIKDIGVLGHDSFKNALGEKAKVVSIFLDVPKDELRRRLLARGEKDIDKRLSRFEFENSHKPKYNYVIKNADKDETIKKIKQIIEENRQE